MRLDCGLQGQDPRLQLSHGKTRHIQDLRGAGLESGEPSRAHGHGLLSVEAQDTINRDELYSFTTALTTSTHSPTEAPLIYYGAEGIGLHVKWERQ